MAIYAYIRVSTIEQDVENQKIGICRKAEELGLVIDEWVIDDGVSGTVEYKERNLGILTEKCKEGDTLIVSEISRLARSVYMLNRIIEELVQIKGVIMHTVKDLSAPLRKNDIMTIVATTFLGISSQIERDMISKRTKEGLAKKKADGVILGRPVGSKQKSPNKKYEALYPQIEEFLKKGLCKTTICKMLDLNISSFDRIVKIYKIQYKKKINSKLKIIKKGA